MSATISKRKTPPGHKAATKTATVVHWRDEAPCEQVSADARLSVESREPFMLHFGHDGWQAVADLDSQPLTSGWHAAALDFKRVGVKQSLEFTRRFIGPRGWEHRDWQVHVKPGHGKV